MSDADGSLTLLSQSVWKHLKPFVLQTCDRTCNHMKHTVQIAILGGIPSLCITSMSDISPCTYPCQRHINVLTSLPFFLEDIKDSSQNYWLYSFVLGPKALGASCGPIDIFVRMKDPAPPPRLFDSSSFSPRFGSGIAHTISGLPGFAYDISDEEINSCDTSQAQEILDKCLLDSLTSTDLHFVSFNIAYGTFWQDPRPAYLIPQVQNWARKLNQDRPDLWTFVDPDSSTWMSLCIISSPVRFGESPSLGYKELAQLYINSAKAFIVQNSKQKGTQDQWESLLVQSSIQKAAWIARKYGDFSSFMNQALNKIIEESDCPTHIHPIFRRAVNHPSLLHYIQEKLQLSYTDGQSHSVSFEIDHHITASIVAFPWDQTVAREWILQNTGAQDYESFVRSLCASVCRSSLISPEIFINFLFFSPHGYGVAIHTCIIDGQNNILFSNTLG